MKKGVERESFRTRTSSANLVQPLTIHGNTSTLWLYLYGRDYHRTDFRSNEGRLVRYTEGGGSPLIEKGMSLSGTPGFGRTGILSQGGFKLWICKSVLGLVPTPRRTSKNTSWMVTIGNMNCTLNSLIVSVVPVRV